MPTILSHPAVPLAIGFGLGSRAISGRLLLAGVAASMAPDLDVYISHYWSAIAHRGITHTPLAALFGALCAALIARALRTTHVKAFLFVFVCLLSHPLLDMCTNGGSGIPLLWPLDDERYFFPWTPIEVSPLGIRRFFSERGLEVLTSEIVWVWVPALVLYATLRRSRHSREGGNPF
ncbi:MAG TPA: metal-dependent hydrolase [Burkholderiales bacterium]|nr:metal-dependent hydrolase [Burkholderiales bacterium]